MQICYAMSEKPESDYIRRVEEEILGEKGKSIVREMLDAGGECEDSLRQVLLKGHNSIERQHDFQQYFEQSFSATPRGCPEEKSVDKSGKIQLNCSPAKGKGDSRAWNSS